MGARVRVVAVVAAAAALVLGGMGIATAAGGAGGSGGDKGRVASTPHATEYVSPDESVFTAITPCRIVDTRVAGGAVSTARAFQVGGSTGFAAQGGTSNGCGIPTDATAIAANVVATGGGHPGYVKAYPTGATAPNASIIDFAAGQTIANELSLAVAPGTSPGLTVSANIPVQVLVDVTGYYAPQITAYVTNDGTLYTATPRVLSVTHPSTGNYTVTVDRDVYDCSATVTTGSTTYYASASTAANDDVLVQTWALSSGAYTAHDSGFQVTVTC